MNTLFEIVLYTDLGASTAGKTADEAFAVAEKLENKYSTTITNSFVFQLNSGSLPRSMDEEETRIIRDSLLFSKKTGGAFDITVFPLVKLWGFINQEYRLPGPASIKQTLPFIGYHSIRLTSNTIKMPSHTQLDLGGILKGYAVDRMVEFLQNKNIAAGIVNAGGNLKVFGVKSDNTPWKIGIRHPREPGEIYKIITLKDGESVSTSGDYERFFITNSIRYFHILDPKTGYPAMNGITSVTVLSPSAEDADALSTGIFVLGLSKGLSFADSNKLPVFIISEKGTNLISTNSKWFKE